MNGSGLNITRDTRTPAEVTRKETGGWTLDFKIPLAMAAVLGFGSMLLFWALMWAIRAMGRGGFWFTAMVVTGGHGLYIIWMAAKYDDKTTTMTTVSALAVSLLTGWFTLCVDQVLFMYAFQAVQVAPFVGLLVFLAMIAVRYVQDLTLFGSPFIEKAIGAVMESKDAPWYAVRRPAPRPLPPDRIQVDVAHSSATGARQHNVVELPFTGVELETAAAIIINGGGITEAALCGSNGKPFPGGKTGRARLREFKEILTIRKWGQDKVEGSPTQGFILTPLGIRIFSKLAKVAPPHSPKTPETNAGEGLDERTNERTNEGRGGK